MFPQTMQTVLSMMLLMALGAFLVGRKWFGVAGMDLLPKFCVRVSIPCQMYCNMLNYISTRERLLELVRQIPIPMIFILFALLIGAGLVRLLKIPKGIQGVFLNATAFSNVVMIGLPVILSVFGERAGSIGMIYYMANTVLFWTIGVYFLRCDSGKSPVFFSLTNLRAIFSPPLIGCLSGIFFVVFGLTLPNFLFSPIQQLGQCVSPLAMIFIGCVLRSAGTSKVRFSKNLAVLLVVRFTLMPAAMLLFCWVFGVQPEVRNVLFILCIMPVMTQLSLMSKESGSDYELTSFITVVTTPISILLLPAYVLLLSLLPA